MNLIWTLFFIMSTIASASVIDIKENKVMVNIKIENDIFF